MSFFKAQDKDKHYSAVAKQEIPVKANAKFSEKEQIAFASGWKAKSDDSRRA